eukprot:2507133-Pyramimonas_sp.AAC.1
MFLLRARVSVDAFKNGSPTANPASQLAWALLAFGEIQLFSPDRSLAKRSPRAASRRKGAALH